MKLKFLIVCALFSFPAHSAPITTWQVDVDMQFDPLSVTWNSATNGSEVTTPYLLRWGVPDTPSGQSGLSLSGPSTTFIDTDGPAVRNTTVTHFNNPVFNPSLMSVSAWLNFILTPPALPPSQVEFLVNFRETPNGDNPCEDGRQNGVGINVDGCSDIFVISGVARNIPFNYLGYDYFFNFFDESGIVDLVEPACIAAGSAFPCIGVQTPELSDTPIYLAAQITTQPVNPVPEPGMLFLLGLGLVSFGVWNIRRVE